MKQSTCDIRSNWRCPSGSEMAGGVYRTVAISRCNSGLSCEWCVVQHTTHALGVEDHYKEVKPYLRFRS